MSKYGEPWRIVDSPHVWSTVGRIDRADEIAIWPIIDSMTDIDGKVETALGLADESGHLARAIACVNACAGMEDPAAVPDLLAACRVFLRLVDIPPEPNETECERAGREAAVELARAAIEKAEGK